MARGRTSWTRRLLLLAAIMLYSALLAADLAPNPFPPLWDWVNRDRPLAPDMVWQERVGARPAAGALVGDTVTVRAGSQAQVYALDNGDLLSERESEGEDGEVEPGWPAEWVAISGGASGVADRVVVTSERLDAGYQVWDPTSGQRLHQDEDAVAVWTFRDARLDLHCADRACRLSAYGPRAATPAWTTDLPGRRDGMLGANPDLAGGSLPTADRIDATVTGLHRLPRVLGFPVERRDGDGVVVVEMATGTVLRVLEPADDEKVMVVGDRVVRSEVAERNGVCVGVASGHDPATGALVWGPEPYHLWTTSVGCEQNDPPVSDGAALVAVGPQGQPLVLDAYDGRVLWTGEPEESVAAVSSELAVVRAADQTTLYAVLLGAGGEPEWEFRAEPDAEVMIGGCGVVVADRDPSRVYVRDPGSGEVRLSAPTTARVLDCAPEGLLLAGGRSIGLLSLDPGSNPAVDPAEPEPAK